MVEEPSIGQCVSSDRIRAARVTWYSRCSCTSDAAQLRPSIATPVSGQMYQMALYVRAKVGRRSRRIRILNRA